MDPNATEFIHTEWNAAAFSDYWENFSLFQGWSNILLGIIILIALIMALRHDWVVLGKRCSAITLFFLSIFCVNLAATFSHMVDHYPPISTILARDLNFINFSAIGFCALWVEIFIVERVRALKKHGFMMKFPIGIFVGFVVACFLLFQWVNWVLRDNPLFVYAIIDYMVSLFVLFAFCLYVIRKLPKEINKGYERNGILTFSILLGASICQVGLQNVLPMDRSWIFNANDVYHVIAAPSFYFIYQSKVFANKVYS